ncbi:GD10846 [Drosophila simulans]|uniref:GD10846 n=1 Tax=Drosophila simulans TaxID=7240 RepID=B4QC93_DROSI|nr:GD10846 [Drosophila simulans]
MTYIPDPGDDVAKQLQGLEATISPLAASEKAGSPWSTGSSAKAEEQKSTQHA